MKPLRPRLRMWHLLGLVAAAAAYFAVGQYRQGVYDPASVQARRLRAFDPASRLAATVELAKMGPEAGPAIPALLGALNDGDPRVRAGVAQLLGRLLMGEDDDPHAGDVRSALIVATRDPEPSARRAAAIALARLEPDPRVAVPALIEAAGDPDREVRGEAVSGLGEFIEDADILVRLRAVGALAWRPSPERLPTIRAAVTPLLKDPNAIIRASAVEALCRNGLTSSDDAPELVAALADPSPVVRARAAIFMPYRPGSRAIIPALTRATSDPEFQVRLEAVNQLRRIGLGAEDARPALRRATEDQEDRIRRDAAEAIRSIEARVKTFRESILPGAIADLADPDPAVRRNAAETLGDFGPRSAPAVPALIRGLADRDATVRLASAPRPDRPRGPRRPAGAGGPRPRPRRARPGRRRVRRVRPPGRASGPVTRRRAFLSPQTAYHDAGTTDFPGSPVMPVTIRESNSGAQLASAEPGSGVDKYEGSWYFDPSAVDQGALKMTERTYTCPYKGTCNWVDFVGPDGSVAKDVAWVYPSPKSGHEIIRGRYGFYAGQRGATREEG